jgi:dipeptidyl aminopeptidase/acylaminoacyl peptidase
MRRLYRPAIAGAAGVVLGSVFAARNAVVIWNLPEPSPSLAEELARSTDCAWEDVRIRAADGAVLDGWIFTPRAPNGGGVILLHGVGDTRSGMLGHARFLLRAGYTVLTPDARGHGASGGRVISYGVLEAEDVRRWADWLVSNRPIERLYGLGASMGAAVLIQSLACEPRFRAVVVECPFASFEQIAYDRLWQATGAPRPLFWPVVNIGFTFVRWRYGFDLRRASPLDAVRATSVPILLIHGDRDSNIEIRHSRAIHSANPRATRLWEVPGAGHVAALQVARADYIRETLGWFASH